MNRVKSVVACGAILLLASCGGTTGTASPGDGRADATTAAKPKSGASKKAAPAHDGTAKIGEKITTDNLVIEITRSGTDKAGAYASGVKQGQQYATFTVRMSNRGTEKFDTALTSVAVSYGKDGDTAQPVFDVKNGGSIKAANTFKGIITKGKAKSGDFAYGVPAKQMNDVQIEVTPGIGQGTAIFAGKIA